MRNPPTALGFRDSQRSRCRSAANTSVAVASCSRCPLAEVARVGISVCGPTAIIVRPGWLRGWLRGLANRPGLCDPASFGTARAPGGKSGGSRSKVARQRRRRCPMRHATWAECEQRVKGRERALPEGASAADEAAILRDQSTAVASGSPGRRDGFRDSRALLHRGVRRARKNFGRSPFRGRCCSSPACSSLPLRVGDAGGRLRYRSSLF